MKSDVMPMHAHTFKCPQLQAHEVNSRLGDDGMLLALAAESVDTASKGT